MKPYGQHNAFKGCKCRDCNPDRNKGQKSAERQKAKKEIKDEISKVAKKTDM